MGSYQFKNTLLKFSRWFVSALILFAVVVQSSATVAQAPNNVWVSPNTNTYPTQGRVAQTVLDDVQRFGPAFDPYAQGGQYVPPSTYAAPPPVVPYNGAGPAPIGSTSIVPINWGGFYAGFEGAILQPYLGTFSVLRSTGGVLPIPAITLTPDYGLEFSPRVWVGYKGAGGLGGRVRWWYFDHDAGTRLSLNGIGDLPYSLDIDTDGDGTADLQRIVTGANARTNLKLNSFDFELTQDGQFHNWDFQVSGGIRYAEIKLRQSMSLTGTHDSIPASLPATDFAYDLSTVAEFEGVGPTIGVSARRPIIFWDGLAFLSNLRVGFLFGDTDVNLFSSLDGVAGTPLTLASQQQLMQVWEAQVGFEYSSLLNGGVRFHMGAYLEAQAWEWNVPTGLGGSDLGFFGPTFSVGFAR